MSFWTSSPSLRWLTSTAARRWEWADFHPPRCCWWTTAVISSPGTPPKTPKDPIFDAHAFSVAIDDEALLDCFLNYPEVAPEQPFVLEYSVIGDAQNNDAELLTALQESPQKYSRKLLATNANLICYTSEPNAPFKICIPDGYLDKIVQWYHQVLSHIGARRLAATIGLHF